VLRAVFISITPIMFRTFRLLLVCGGLLWCNTGVRAQDSSPQASRRILVFGDVASNNPAWQQALMERSIHQVADAFKAHPYEVDLIPTAQLTSRVVKERLAQYARTLTTNDTFAMYSHSHGGPRGTFFANWSELTDSILAIPARDVVIFAMSCHSGNLTDTLTRRKPEWEGRSKAGRSLVVLTPVSAAQLCSPSPERGVGNPFTYAVTTALQGAADGISGDGKDGRIGMKELVDYVLKTTREKSRGRTYEPQFAGEYPEGVTFVTCPSTPVNAAR
jgi:hypothetical protein